jgi:hypothetical protein
VELLLNAKQLKERTNVLFSTKTRELIETDLRIILEPKDIIAAASIGVVGMHEEFTVEQVYSSQSHRVFKRNKFKPWGRIHAPFDCVEELMKIWVSLWSDGWCGYSKKKCSFR